MSRLVLLLALTLLAACAGRAEPPQARGDIIQLNPQKWTATTNDITTEPNL
jgi:outer membrane biogenesis lipoprotein LolB